MKFLGKDISGPFTIPSGIITVTWDAILHLAKASDELGVLTTKSIGPEPRSGNREPVLAQPDPNSRDHFQNAVGLAGPGCVAFAKELAASPRLPSNKFLLISIFGQNAEEFVEVAKTLQPYADGFELNFSCPHAEGHGSELCATAGLAAGIVRSLRAALPDTPIIPKVSPNIKDDALKTLIFELVEAGAHGFCAINTVGPKKSDVLTKKIGGISGPKVLERALNVVQLIRDTLNALGKHDIPVIGMGGIANSSDVHRMKAAGAAIVGVGTSLLGLDTAQCIETMRWLNQPPSALSIEAVEKLRRDAPDMAFRDFTVARVIRNQDYNAVIEFKESIVCRPGQFVMVWIPEYGEKPLAPARQNPCTLIIRNVGILTKRMVELSEGDVIKIRGVYGTSFYVPTRQPSPMRRVEVLNTHLNGKLGRTNEANTQYVLVGGSTGIAPIFLLTLALVEAGVPASALHVFLGGSATRDIYLYDDFRAIATVHVATMDGSIGLKGSVVTLLSQKLEEWVKGAEKKPTFVFYNCGPEGMMYSAYTVQSKYPRTHLQCSIERYMKCGVGICGVCTCDGLRMCVDGPVVNDAFLQSSAFFGKLHRDKTTQLLKW